MQNTMAGALRDLLVRKSVIAAPCAYDALSAACIEAAGFRLIGTTGFGMHGAMLGTPDNGMLAFNEMVEACSKMVDAVNVPIMADAEGGYGNAVNTYRTVRCFEKAGLAGLFIEDQNLPPNCPFYKPTQMISTQEMCGKIHAACDARKNDDFVIVARTDAHGQEAVERCNAYAEAGADLVKIIPLSRQELESYPLQVKAPLHLGFMPGRGINDGMTVQDAGNLGYKIVTFPMTVLFASVRAMMDVLKALKEQGTDESLLSQMTSFDDYFRLVKAERFRTMEKDYLPG